VHLFTLLVLLAGYEVGQHSGLSFNMLSRLSGADFVRNIFLVQAWGFSDDVSWNGPAWSISCEWFAYLLFPFIVMMVLRVRSVRGAWMGFVIMYALLLGYFERAGYTNTTTSNDGALVRVITQFIVGCLLYRIYQSGWGRRINWAWISYALIAMVLAWQY